MELKTKHRLGDKVYFINEDDISEGVVYGIALNADDGLFYVIKTINPYQEEQDMWTSKTTNRKENNVFETYEKAVAAYNSQVLKDVMSEINDYVKEFNRRLQICGVNKMIKLEVEDINKSEQDK